MATGAPHAIIRSMAHPPADRPLAFRCEGEALDTVVGSSASVVLGGFDGRDTRHLHAYAVHDRDAQLMVSMHEQLHHELHWSTGWGVIAAMAGLLADAGIDEQRLRPVAAVANAACRHVHEIFATTISAGVLGVDVGRRLLGANPVYQAYLDEGIALGGAAQWPWQFRESATQMLLRSLMQPLELAAIAELGLDRIRTRDLARPALQPDQRLLLVSAGAGRWWEDTFERLAREYPGRGGDRGGPMGRSLPDDQGAMEALKDWEETVLIPELQAVATAELRRAGMEIMDGERYLEVVGALRESLLALGPAEWQVEILADRRPLSREPLGAEREVIMLHRQPLRVTLYDQEQLGAESTRFLHEQSDGGPVVIAYYLLAGFLQRQFTGLEDLGESGPPLLGIVAHPHDDADGPTLPIAALTPNVTPLALTEMFRSLPVLPITSLSTTREPECRELVLDLPRAFIVVDLPLRRQVDAWIASGGTVRFRAIQLTGDRVLNLTVFALDELDEHWFLSFRTDAGFGELAQLLDRHPDKLIPGLELDDEQLAAILAVSKHIFGCWWRFEESWS